MLATIAFITVVASLAFLSVVYYFRSEIIEKMRPPQRVPVVIRVDEEIRRKTH
jgi:hypothetical protein